MSVIVCSIFDIKKCARGEIYSTSVGNMQGMGLYEKLAFLAPHWDMVMGHKNGSVSDQEYKDRYRQMLANEWDEVQVWLNGLQAEQDITLLCYCAEGKFCHRRILAQLIKHYRPDIEVVVH